MWASEILSNVVDEKLHILQKVIIQRILSFAPVVCETRPEAWTFYCNKDKEVMKNILKYL